MPIAKWLVSMHSSLRHIRSVGGLAETVKPKVNVSVGPCALVNVSRHKPCIEQHCRTGLLSKTFPPKSAQPSAMEHC